MVEVRQRATLDFGGALESVTAAKRRKLLCAALFALQRRPAWRSRRMRFDVIGVQGALHGTCSIAWIKDAFRAG
jgi:putative endonuclease